MRLKLSEITPVAGVLIALFALVTTYTGVGIARQSYLRGPIPEKSLSVQNFVSSDALEAIREAHGVVSASVVAADVQIQNLFVTTEIIENTGLAPILPSDIFERITLSTETPWKMIAVTSAERVSNHIVFRWKRDSDTKFSAEPALINPGDQIWTTVYTTYLGGDPQLSDTLLTPPLTVNARIANLSSIVEKKYDNSLDILKSQWLPFTIFSITGNQIFFILFSFSVYLLIYIYLLRKLSLFGREFHKIGLAIVPVGILSISAAECGSGYVVQQLTTANNSLVIDAPIILANIATMGVLFWRAMSHSSPTIDSVGPAV